MSKNKKIKQKYTTLAFSTNISELLPSTILKIFLSNNFCINTKYINENRIEYDYLIDNDKDNVIHTIFVEAKSLNKKYEINRIANSYLIIIDLEKDNTYKELDSIILYILNNCDLEKKTFVIAVYKDVNNIKEELKEENIKDYIDNKRINYEYLELNINNSNDLIQIIEFIIKQSVSNEDNQEGKIDRDKGKSKSNGCHIF